MAVGMSLKFGSSAQNASLCCIYWWHSVREGQEDLPYPEPYIENSMNLYIPTAEVAN